MATILIEKDSATLIQKTVTTAEREAWAVDFKVYDVNADGSKSVGYGPTRVLSRPGAVTVDTPGLRKIGPDGRAQSAPPARIVPYTPSGTTYYTDPSAAVHGSGTFLSPYKDLRDLPYPDAGSLVLFKAGTTYQPSGGFIDIIPGSLPSSIATSVVFGVYDGTTGARLSGRGAGLATIDGQNTQPFGIRADHANARAFVCVDGLKIINTTDGGNGRLKFTNCANWQILNCDVTGSLAKGIFSDRAVGANYFEGNVALNCGEAGIIETITAASASVFQYNQICGIDISGSYAFTGSVIGNSIQGVSGRTSNGVSIAVSGGALTARRNAIRQCLKGVAITGAGATPDDFTGAFIEDNQIERCKFGVYLNNCNGVVAQYNEIDRCGTYDGETAFATDNFGRAFELWGASSTTGPKNCKIRFNTISRTFSLNSDGTEGVGIGFDNNALDCEAYGNVISDSWGNGIQSNRAIRCTAAANVIINAWCGPAGAYPNITPSGGGRMEGAICHVVSPGFIAANNTIICGTGPYSRYGLSEAHYNTAGGSPGARLYNNVVIGAPIAAILRDTTTGKTTEDSNIFENCWSAVLNGVGTATSTASASVRSGTTGISATSYRPTGGCIADGSGVDVLPHVVAMDGVPLAFRAPKGALSASRALSVF